MSPFIIFVIVLTIGYLLYYAAVIATDVATQNKKAAGMEETIAAGDGDDDDAPQPQSVMEDPDTGGFSFGEPEPAQPFAPISEEEEISEEEPEEAPEPAEETPEETPEEEPEATTTIPDDDLPPVVHYTGEEPEEEKPELFDVSQVFDPSLTQPTFDVSKVIEPSASPATIQHSHDVSDALETIRTHGNQHTALNLSQILHNADLTAMYNLDTKDEITKQ